MSQFSARKHAEITGSCMRAVNFCVCAGTMITLAIGQIRPGRKCVRSRWATGQLLVSAVR